MILLPNFQLDFCAGHLFLPAYVPANEHQWMLSDSDFLHKRREILFRVVFSPTLEKSFSHSVFLFVTNKSEIGITEDRPSCEHLDHNL